MNADARSYEHIDPTLVGNDRRVLVSELSGRGTILAKARELGLDVDEDPERVAAILSRVKDLEHEGYHYETADGSFELLIERETGVYEPLFTLESFRVITEKRADGRVETEATVKLFHEGQRIVATAEGNGPVNALDAALRQAIGGHFPALAGVHLTDYKVRVLDTAKGTAAVTRVLIDSTDGERTWSTIGVSENIIEASWQALSDSIVYGLLHAGTQE
jgi:2-isopropylmalate synthase